MMVYLDGILIKYGLTSDFPQDQNTFKKKKNVNDFLIQLAFVKYSHFSIVRDFCPKPSKQLYFGVCIK